jgi:hypothetical protein
MWREARKTRSTGRERFAEMAAAFVLAAPATYIFEGVGTHVIDQVFSLMLSPLALNALYFGAATFAFLELFESARRQGTLMNRRIVPKNLGFPAG